MTLAELARLIGARLQGDGAIEVAGVAPLGEAQKGEVTFIADAVRWHKVADCPAEAFIVPESIATEAALGPRPLLIAADAKLAFARAIRLFYEQPYAPRGVSPDLILGAGSRIGRDCSIHPRVSIGRETLVGDRVTLHPGVVLGDRVKVGDETVLFANVSVYDETEIGARCRIHSGTVIGSDGFSFVPDEQGRQFKLLQVGRVLIEDEVEIGANCCVDRAGFGLTHIRRGAKFDNLIQIGHNCELGEDTVVAALVGFSGGTKVGRQVIIGGQTGTNQHIAIGDRTIVTARTGVTKSVEAGRIVGGLPVQDHRQWRRTQALIARLPELFERLKQLEKVIGH